MSNRDQKKFRKYTNPDVNPCLKEAEQSMKCLEANHYVNNKCYQFFNNYNKCKEFWNMIKGKRSQNGIKPEMPTEKERKLILSEKEKGNLVYFAHVDND